VNWLDMVCFVPLAVLSNTALPLSFDPVLIYFASRQSPSAAFALALIGSVCAGLAAAADVQLLKYVRTKTSDRWLAWMPHWRGRRLYVLTFLFALLPLPFSVVRLAVVRHSPETLSYGAAVALGRLPRYLLTVSLWGVLGLPARSSEILFCAGLIFAMIQMCTRRGLAVASIKNLP